MCIRRWVWFCLCLGQDGRHVEDVVGKMEACACAVWLPMATLDGTLMFDDDVSNKRAAGGDWKKLA